MHAKSWIKSGTTVSIWDEHMNNTEECLMNSTEEMCNEQHW